MRDKPTPQRFGGVAQHISRIISSPVLRDCKDILSKLKDKLLHFVSPTTKKEAQCLVELFGFKREHIPYLGDMENYHFWVSPRKGKSSAADPSFIWVILPLEPYGPCDIRSISCDKICHIALSSGRIATQTYGFLEQDCAKMQWRIMHLWEIILGMIMDLDRSKVSGKGYHASETFCLVLSNPLSHKDRWIQQQFIVR